MNPLGLRSPETGIRADLLGDGAAADYAVGMKSRVHPTYKTKYRVGNWASYDRALVRRGDVTFWVSPDAIATWELTRGGTRGGQLKYPAPRHRNAELTHNEWTNHSGQVPQAPASGFSLTTRQASPSQG